MITTVNINIRRQTRRVVIEKILDKRGVFEYVKDERVKFPISMIMVKDNGMKMIKDGPIL